ncbi:MAG TPA: FAD-dependent oxidoreductase [Steroidobacteraceae bacterium]|jgi:hypothetical protein|nr:FAD-dependent oxidoreductase [Steroidobacteraceae bacterium]
MTSVTERLPAAVVVGAGPGGFGLLFAARQAGLLDELRAAGIRILERGRVVGAGAIGQYDIRSDSHADSFLKAIDQDVVPDLRHLLGRSSGSAVHSRRGDAVELNLIGELLTEAATELHEQLKGSGWDPVIPDAEALHAKRRRDGAWTTSCRIEGRELQLSSRTLVLATGAHQPIDRLYRERIAGLPLLPGFADKTIQSGDLIGLEGRAKWAQHIAHRDRPKIVIVGGSHSALASACWCLYRSGCERFGRHAVTLLHRGSLRLTYPSAEAARADGYTGFDEEDICLRSGRVFPLAGFRSDSRDLLRRHWGMGGLSSDDRLCVRRLAEHADTAAMRLLEEADLVIAALGYRPRALPLRDETNTRVPLLADADRGPLVDGFSRVLDGDARPIEGVFGIGLSSGYPLAGVHGERSFAGEANGLALWQSDIGIQIVRQILALSTTARHVG